MQEQMTKERYEALLRKTRFATDEEVDHMSKLIGQEVLVLCLWDGKLKMEETTIVNVGNVELRTKPITLPFKGQYCGILCISYMEKTIYEVLSE